MNPEVKIRRELIRLAIHMLDSQDGIDMDTFNYLKACLVQEGSYDCQELLQNVSVHQQRAFLNEDWVEENFARFE